MEIADNKLFVCNSGGYITDKYDSTVSVIDLFSFMETEKIVVGLNPTRIRKDNQGHLWVCCQGNYKERKPEVVVLDAGNIIKRIPTPCANISIQGSTAYIIDNEENNIKTISTIDYTLSTFNISTSFEHPYGLLATQEALYITDAKNYVSSGVLHCYDYNGLEHWKVLTGDIPGHMLRVTGEYDLYPDTTGHDTKSSPYITHVYDYMPAMGQYVNELPKYTVGDDAASMCRKCEQSIANNAKGMVSLGGWGGYITFGFDHPVKNEEGSDIQILGNAFTMTGNAEYGSSEPGIVLVSVDDNENGLPDDTWYELKGCLYDDINTNHHYTKTYTRASDTVVNPFHKHPQYPQWIESGSLTFNGSLLPSQTTQISGQYVQKILDYGYVDNKPNKDINGTSFDISWAIDADGTSVSLPTIDFVRVYNAVDETYPMIGELSTEVCGAIDLHIQH